MREFWKCTLSEKYMGLDKPREDMVKVLRSYLVKGYKIIILTDRVKQHKLGKPGSSLGNGKYHTVK